ncbi:tripartite tricarboxylate transporter substrate binding protein [Marispirochaeta aestuarii]|uniref:tripartite tricarboxylate transporter substrate binding protein n=1 Tax=Marispirochaeta aestuarii TaxID=1963862 RepID=UPI0029C79A2B|nr:tripartite tricarboxylate transporter substrate binding protein [Marispirochaeta aestuarii]
MMKRLLIVLLITALAAPLMFANGEAEQGGQAAAKSAEWPTRPIEVIVPAGPGGDTDVNSRILAKYLEKELGQPVVVVNVGGAGGSLGSRRVLDAKPDGNTILFFHPGLLLNKLLGLVDYSFQDYKLGGLAVLDETNAFVGSAKAPYKDMRDITEASRKNPESISFATEVGSFTHLHLLAYQQAAGVKLNIVDVGGAAAKTAALLGNQIDIIGTQYGLVSDYIKSGDFHALGVMSEKRNPSFPDVPTFKEMGYDVSFTKFFYYAFPKETPDSIVETFTAALKNVVNNPDYAAEAKKTLLVTATYMTPEDTYDFLSKQEAMYKSIMGK